MQSRKTLLPFVFTIVGMVPLFASSQSSAAEERRPGVRYTSGTYCIKGWEKQLVGGNSNLGHWNWAPMVGYTQSVAPLPTGKQAHEAPMPEQRSHYVKPIHVALPHVQIQTARAPEVHIKNTKKVVVVEPPVVAPSPVLSYSSYSSYNGFTTHSIVQGTLAHKDGTAQLIHSGKHPG